ncbi:MAG: metal-dependent hydrolase family protein, partial [Chloroflexota bacterium]
IRGVVNARRTLDAGYTTLRDCGAHAFENVAVAQATRLGLVVGPRMLACGPWLSISGRHEYARWRPEIEVHFPGRVDSPDEARRAARLAIYHGADFIKVRASGNVHTEGTEPTQAELSEAEIRAAVEVAHDKGVRVASHAHALAAVKNSLRAGVDTIEHGSFLDEEAVELLLKNDAYLVPTLSFVKNLLSAQQTAGAPEFALRKARLVHEAQQTSFSMALKAGVRIAAGSDAGMLHTHHGSNADELLHLVSAGMRPEQALLAATRFAAEAMGLADSVGTIEKGRRADLLAVASNPLSDVGSLRGADTIQLIVRDGAIHFSASGLAAQVRTGACPSAAPGDARHS